MWKFFLIFSHIIFAIYMLHSTLLFGCGVEAKRVRTINFIFGDLILFLITKGKNGSLDESGFSNQSLNGDV